MTDSVFVALCNASRDAVVTEPELRSMGVSPALSAAYDVLDDAGFLREDRLMLCRAAELQGRCPEAFARHLVKLCKATQVS